MSGYEGHTSGSSPGRRSPNNRQIPQQRSNNQTSSSHSHQDAESTSNHTLFRDQPSSAVHNPPPISRYPTIVQPRDEDDLYHPPSHQLYASDEEERSETKQHFEDQRNRVERARSAEDEELAIISTKLAELSKELAVNEFTITEIGKLWFSLPLEAQRDLPGTGPRLELDELFTTFEGESNPDVLVKIEKVRERREELSRAVGNREIGLAKIILNQAAEEGMRLSADATNLELTVSRLVSAYRNRWGEQLVEFEGLPTSTGYPLALGPKFETTKDWFLRLPEVRRMKELTGLSDDAAYDMATTLSEDAPLESLLTRERRLEDANE